MFFCFCYVWSFVTFGDTLGEISTVLNWPRDWLGGPHTVPISHGHRTHVPWVAGRSVDCKTFSCLIMSKHKYTFEKNDICVGFPDGSQYVFTSRDSQLRVGCVQMC